MEEIKLVFIVLIKSIFVLLAATLYALGGRDDIFWWTKKFIRRYVSPMVAICGGVFCFNFVPGDNNPYLYFGAIISSYGIYIASFSMGYGASSKIEKVKKRAIVGLTAGLACFPFILVGGNTFIIVFSLVMAVIGSCVFGVCNPVSAADEEFMIASFYFGLLPIIF